METAELSSTSFTFTIGIAIAAMLVFMMQGGFSFMETGFTRTKNTVSIFMKNIIGLSLSMLFFTLIGYQVMFDSSPFVWNSISNNLSTTQLTHYLFNAITSALVATIATGAISERTRFTAYIVATIIISAIIYPISGSWIWGNGWLATLNTPFHDFSGAAAIQMTAGWMALAATLILGVRLDKKHIRFKAIPGQNLAYSALGLFLTWLGWQGLHLGFGMIKAANLPLVLINTNLAACTATIATMLSVWIKYGKPSFSLTINGTIAGLAAISAGADVVSPLGAIIIGLLAGVALVFSVSFIESHFKIDDPVGAISIHGVCGSLGVILTGVLACDGGLLYGFGTSLLISQITGMISIAAWAMGSGLLLFFAIKKTIKLRVDKRVENEGLDIYEHGETAYN
jgi:Amt family ammonium transporter